MIPRFAVGLSYSKTVSSLRLLYILLSSKLKFGVYSVFFSRFTHCRPWTFKHLSILDGVLLWPLDVDHCPLTCSAVETLQLHSWWDRILNLVLGLA